MCNGSPLEGVNRPYLKYTSTLDDSAAGAAAAGEMLVAMQNMRKRKVGEREVCTPGAGASAAAAATGRALMTVQRARPR